MYKTILIPIGSDEEVETRVKAAVKIGKKFDAHIRALHVVPTLKSLEQITPYAYYSYDLYTNIWEAQKQKACEQKKAFLSMMDGEYDNFEWCGKEGDFMRTLKLMSRSCNLSIISQGEDTYSDLMGSMARFMMESSTPVLAVPCDGMPDYTGDNIMIAWDNSAEASRAVHNALPFLEQAKEVTVLSISEERKHKSPTEDVCNMLSRMGINAKGVDEEEDGDRAERILHLAKVWDTDLIVAGAWGHKRLLEVIFGGVTKTLYTNQEIPVLFSH
ncbi:universal stress protein [Pseudemcibacter aquimaris]|uniref:universal stress protein n=1 Tax=Pseudemcibacter aquimaris TaxID=2857064 RepID=UPI002012166F|nr:universal stress protein [Pseudemcibacter aquimaris]MCC3859721.1 universal stress protein [Pseudemcibacter aquimaris]WDU60116.1 universal stress protein [Pseudemcibacter aquimaris]